MASHMPSTLLLLLLALLCAAAVAAPATHATRRLTDKFPPERPLRSASKTVTNGLQRTAAGEWVITPRASQTASFAAGDYAFASYDMSYLQDGWNYLEVYTNPALPDVLTAEAAGFLEGQMSAQDIFNSATSSNAFLPISRRLERFLSDNSDWMQDQITQAKTRPSGDPTRLYWEQVELVLIQVSGFHLGYMNSTTGNKHPMTAEQIFWMNLGGDLEDLVFSVQETPPTREELFKAREHTHCSALVRLLENNADLLVVAMAVATWAV